MTDLRSTGVCLYCGTERSYNVASCHRCGRGWPDRRVDELDAELLTPQEAGHSRLLDDPGSGPPSRWWIPAAIALVVLVGIYAITRVVAGNSDPTTTEAAVPAPAAAAPPTSTVSTTIPPTTTATSAAPTTTPTTTSTTTTTTLPPIDPIGEPITTDDLTLGAFALGPLRLGDPAVGVLGRLTATFGQPDSIEAADASWGLCEGDPGRVVRFGPLAIVLAGDPSAETFAAYRLDAEPKLDPFTQIATISGIQLEASFAELDAAYEASITERFDVDGMPVFVVLRSSDRRTLLWGRMSGEEDDALILGIYSPRPCDRGPRA